MFDYRTYLSVRQTRLKKPNSINSTNLIYPVVKGSLQKRQIHCLGPVILSKMLLNCSCSMIREKTSSSRIIWSLLHEHDL